MVGDEIAKSIVAAAAEEAARTTSGIFGLL